MGIFLTVTFKHGPTLFPHCYFPSFDGHLIIKHLIISTNAFRKNIKARMLINQKANLLFRHIVRDLGKRERTSLVGRTETSFLWRHWICGDNDILGKHTARPEQHSLQLGQSCGSRPEAHRGPDGRLQNET